MIKEVKQSITLILRWFETHYFWVFQTLGGGPLTPLPLYDLPAANAVQAHREKAVFIFWKAGCGVAPVTGKVLLVHLWGTRTSKRRLRAQNR